MCFLASCKFALLLIHVYKKEAMPAQGEPHLLYRDKRHMRTYLHLLVSLMQLTLPLSLSSPKSQTQKLCFSLPLLSLCCHLPKLPFLHR